MHVKGINPFEKHVEKGVLALVGVVALGIIAWQFVGPPNTVKVNNKDVPIDQAYTALQTTANEVQAKVKQGFEPPPIQDLDMLGTFEKLRTGPVARQSELAWAGEAGGIRVGEPGSAGIGGRLKVQAVAAPAPAAPTAVTYLATIAPAEVTAAPELAALLPKSMPFDMAAVSVETTFDGAALGRILASDPDGDGPLAQLPIHWWQDRMHILAVELEREQLQPDGTWSGLTVVPAMPGRYSLRKEIAAGVPNLSALEAILTEAAAATAAIRRPSFYQTVFGENWVPPTEARVDFQLPNQAEINRWTREHDAALQQIASLEERLGAIPADDPSKNAQRQQIQRSLDQAIQRRDKARNELRALGVAVEGDVDAAQPVVEQKAEPALLSDPAARVWNHDLTAERGKTYRYRVVLVLTNPIFGQSAAIEAELSPLAAEPFVRTPPSPWTQPIQVDPDTYFFVGTAQDQPVNAAIGGGPRASVELYVFRWGYWRKATTTLEPGDPVAAEVRIPDFAAMQPELVNPSPAQPENPIDPTAPNGPATDPNAPVEPIYTQIVVTRDAYLLDVAAVPAIRDQGLGTAGPQFQAFLRDSDGSIVVRSPDSERQSQSYQRVARSAALGEQALRPKTVVTTPTPGPRPRGEPERPADGGKGGGSGGG